MKTRAIVLAVTLILMLWGTALKAQTSCSGSYTTTSASCQRFTIGNGSAGAIVICLTANNIPSGGGTSCGPGGSCNPPFSGGGWSPRINIYTSGGSNVTTWSAATAVGTCYTLSTTDGYAEIIGICLTAGTSFSWTTINQCGASICASSPTCAGQPCASCTAACAACGFTSNPTVSTVTANCPGNTPAIPFGSGQTYKVCSSFTAAATTVTFNSIIQSNCGSGNVSAFTWTLQSAACGANIQTGTLSNLTFSNLTIGTAYVFCYQFTVPNSVYCQHTVHWPYYVGAQPLPIELVSFNVENTGEAVVAKWATASEKNNDHFIVERSHDAHTFSTVGKVNGAGSSRVIKYYSLIDAEPISGTSYYRLKQVDFDGAFKYSPIKTLSNTGSEAGFLISPNPSNSKILVQYECFSKELASFNIYNDKGEIVKTVNVKCNEGLNEFNVDLSAFSSGLYFIIFNSGTKQFKSKFIKN